MRGTVLIVVVQNISFKDPFKRIFVINLSLKHSSDLKKVVVTGVLRARQGKQSDGQPCSPVRV